LLVTRLDRLARFERSMILARTANGRTRAQPRGVRFGRKPKLTPHQITEALPGGKLGRPSPKSVDRIMSVARPFDVLPKDVERICFAYAAISRH
jgi:DNA invertase Pin-like site-specific DNA recombinase